MTLGDSPAGEGYYTRASGPSEAPTFFYIPQTYLPSGLAIDNIDESKHKALGTSYTTYLVNISQSISFRSHGGSPPVIAYLLRGKEPIHSWSVCQRVLSVVLRKATSLPGAKRHIFSNLAGLRRMHLSLTPGAAHFSPEYRAGWRVRQIKSQRSRFC